MTNNYFARLDQPSMDIVKDIDTMSAFLSKNFIEFNYFMHKPLFVRESLPINLSKIQEHAFIDRIMKDSLYVVTLAMQQIIHEELSDCVIGLFVIEDAFMNYRITCAVYNYD